jgi:hypothetical protein
MVMLVDNKEVGGRRKTDVAAESFSVRSVARRCRPRYSRKFRSMSKIVPASLPFHAPQTQIRKERKSKKPGMTHLKTFSNKNNCS